MIKDLLKKCVKGVKLRRGLSLGLAIMLSMGLLPLGEFKASAKVLDPKVEVGGMSPEEFESLYNEGNLPEMYATGDSGMAIELLPGIVAPQITIDGEIGYCLNLYKNFPVGSNYPTSSPYEDRGMRSILYHGYPTDKSGLQGKYGISPTQARYYTQVAIWQYVGDIADRDRGVPYLNELMAKAKAGDLGTHSFQVSPNRVDATQMGGYQETSLVNTSGANGTFDFQSDSNAWSVDTDGNNKNTFNIGESFKVRGSAGYNGEKTMNITTSIENPAALQYNPANTSNQKIIKFQWGDPIRDPKRLKVQFNGTGNIELTKFSENGSLLEGVKFGLFTDFECNNKISEAVTGADGKLRFNDMVVGKYFIKELEAPTGHVLSTEVKEVTISGGDIQTVSFTNEIIKGRVSVKKVDIETGEALAGAEFELKKKDTEEVVETLVTRADGMAISGLHNFGEYILKESKAPNMYTIDGKEYPVTISEHMQTIEITHSNRIIKGQVSIEKIDSETKQPIEGVKFELKNLAGTIVDTLITDAQGKAISKLLNYGFYTLSEAKEGTGYLPNGTIWNVEITEDGKVYNYNIENEIITGKIQIVKIDSVNAEKPVEGAVFNVVADNVIGVESGTVVDTVTTDKDGFAFTKDLRYGEYYIEEIYVGPDYWLNGNRYPVSVTENAKVYIKHIKNEPVLMKLRVLKMDSEDKSPIKNTKFKIVNRITGEDVVFTKFLGIIPIKFTEFKTDKNGEIIIPQNLAYGSYNLVEVDPAEGYNPIDPIPFEINRDTNYEEIELLGKIHTIEVENTKIKGNVELLKYDTDSKEAIPGVTFKFECTSGFDKGKTWEVVSDENGLVKLDNINYGKYKATEISTVEGYVLNKKPIPFEIKNNGETIKLEMNNNRIKGDVELLKFDADSKQPMKNVEFLVECLDGFDKGTTWTLFTGENGIINLDKFNYGKYIVKEVKTLDGYILNENPILFEITEDGQKIELEMENDRIKSDFTLLKVDAETGEPLSNALFKITCTEGFDKGKTWELYSDDYGLVRLNDANWGKYEVTEIKTPNDGYVLNTEVIKFDVKEHGENIKFEFTNRKVKSNMELLKVDADTKKPMPFVTFKVTCVEGFDLDQEYILETDNDGIIKLDDLTAGIYRIDEVSTVEGYILNEEPMFFTVQNDGETIELEMENTVKKGTVILEKLDEDTKKPLEGITFELCRGDQVIGTYTTDKDGRIEVKDLPWGNYYFVEIETKETHILDQDKFYDFFIEEDKQLIEITALNKIKEGELDFSKTDVSTGELLDGAEIKIEGLDEWNKHINIEFTSSKDGNRFKLPVGKYKFTENLAPIGYEISTEVGYFEITEGGTTKAELKNKKIVKEELPYTGGTPAAATMMFGLLMTLGGFGLTKKRTNK